MSGWIKIYRKIREWGWYSDPITKSLFLHLLITANHEDGIFMGIEIKRGDAIVGRDKTSRELGITERQFRTSMNRLKSTNEVTIKTTSKFSIVTVCNYELYQDTSLQERPAKRPAKRPTNDQQTTSKRPANDHIKEVKNGRIKNTSSENEKFTSFWNAYPKKTAKKDALKAWNKLNCGNGSFSTIMEKLEQFKQSDSWTRDNGRYIPNPASWLNGERWNDEVECRLPSKGQKIGGLTF